MFNLGGGLPMDFPEALAPSAQKTISIPATSAALHTRVEKNLMLPLSPDISHALQHVLINTGALARCNKVLRGVSRFNGFPRLVTNC